MDSRISARLAWLLCLGSVALGLGAMVLVELNGTPIFRALVEGELLSAVAALTFPVVGALIASHRPDNVTGWIFLAIGLSQGIVEFSYLYAVYAFVTKTEPLPGAEVAAWLNTWTWMPGFGSMMTFLPLVFPTGALLSRRWQAIAWLSFLSIGLMSLVTAVSLWPLRGPQLLGDVEANITWFEPALLLLLGCGVASTISLILRFRRSKGHERLQLKLFAFVVTAAVLFFSLEGLELMPDALTGSLGLVMAAGVPIAAGVAILKHRLYDIDLIINRTLVYAGLSGLLVLVYAGGVFGIGSVLRTMTGQERSSLAVAVSTLAVAALFRPARSRIQAFIDRRFYRSKYDATLTLQAFSARLRNEVDLGTISEDLVSAVQKTVQPAHASLWLRRPH